MNIKKWIIVGSIVAANMLPFSSNAQKTKENIMSWTKTELLNTVNKEIINKNWEKIFIKESHEEIVNMQIGVLQEKYKENLESVFNYYMLAEINRRREKLNLKPFIQDKDLTEKCQRWAKYMLDNKSRWHEINWKTSNNMWISINDYSIVRENITYESIKATISEIIENWQYSDDESNKRTGKIEKKWEERRNHKRPIISNDIDRFWCGIAIDWKTIYIGMNSWAKF